MHQRATHVELSQLDGCNPSCLAKAATGAVAISSSLDRKTTRWPPSTALFTINRAIARAKESGAEFDLSELLRIESQVLAAQHDPESAMSCLTEALAVARAQSALALKLRSTMDLARLLSEDGQCEQARHALALVYDRFTEGFKTADLEFARALLEDLR